MKVIKNIRKRRIEKFKARQQATYAKLAEKKIAAVEKDCGDEIDKIEKRYDAKLSRESARYDQEIKIIRSQERQRWDAIIAEREQEIERLRAHINDRAKFYEALKLRELEFEDTARGAVVQFERALEKIKEGMQIMVTGQSKIEAYNIKIAKKNGKMPLIKNE